jgi:small nuclear ribonucleoprotein (snRNP)-like protein
MPKLKPRTTHAQILKFPDKTLSEGHRRPLVQGRDYKIISLDKNNIGTKEGQRMFQEMQALLLDNFPREEIESDGQYHWDITESWRSPFLVDLAVDKSGKVIGAKLYNYSPTLNIIMTNITVVAEGKRNMGLATALDSNSYKRVEGLTGKKVELSIYEIERPDKSTGDKMRNEIRPKYHDNITKAHAIRLQSGEPLLYVLPIMASPEERQQAIEDGEPFGEVDLMFCISPKMEIDSRKVASLLTWFYKEYLTFECNHTVEEEIDSALTRTLERLGADPNEVERCISKKDFEGIANSVPLVGLELIKISETAE